MFSVLIVNIVRTRVFKIRVYEAVDLVRRYSNRRLHHLVCCHPGLGYVVRVSEVCVSCVVTCFTMLLAAREH